MAGGDLGPWDPIGIDELARLLEGAPCRWWVSGGRAYELHLGRSWRDHGDTDVGICREDVAIFVGSLTDLELVVAAGGELRPYRGGALSGERHENNLWCRRAPGGPFILDVQIGEGDPSRWVYRRDPTVTRPWDEVVRRSPAGVPYLSPEIQLLFSSVHHEARHDLDARIVVPELTTGERAWLGAHLADGHPWHELVRAD
jgi:hypothetical protein